MVIKTRPNLKYGQFSQVFFFNMGHSL